MASSFDSDVLECCCCDDGKADKSKPSAREGELPAFADRNSQRLQQLDEENSSRDVEQLSSKRHSGTTPRRSDSGGNLESREEDDDDEQVEEEDEVKKVRSSRLGAKPPPTVDKETFDSRLERRVSQKAELMMVDELADSTPKISLLRETVSMKQQTSHEEMPSESASEEPLNFGEFALRSDEGQAARTNEERTFEEEKRSRAVGENAAQIQPRRSSSASSRNSGSEGEYDLEEKVVKVGAPGQQDSRCEETSDSPQERRHVSEEECPSTVGDEAGVERQIFQQHATTDSKPTDLDEMPTDARSTGAGELVAVPDGKTHGGDVVPADGEQIPDVNGYQLGRRTSPEDEERSASKGRGDDDNNNVEKRRQVGGTASANEPEVISRSHDTELELENDLSSHDETVASCVDHAGQRRSPVDAIDRRDHDDVKVGPAVEFSDAKVAILDEETKAATKEEILAGPILVTEDSTATKTSLGFGTESPQLQDPSSGRTDVIDRRPTRKLADQPANQMDEETLSKAAAEICQLAVARAVEQAKQQHRRGEHDISSRKSSATAAGHERP